jgi:putative transposase
MKRSRFTDEQIACALRQVDGGSAVADVCRQVGISEATFYVWKKKYANLGSTEIRELRQLRDCVSEEQAAKKMKNPALRVASHGRVN